MQKSGTLNSSMTFYQTQPILFSRNRTTACSDKELIVFCWAENFGCLFSDHKKVVEASIGKVSNVELKLELNELSMNAIQTDIYQHGYESLVGRLRSLFVTC